MAIAVKTPPSTVQRRRAQAQHHRRTKQYVKTYWPYLPMALLLVGGFILNGALSKPSRVLGVNTDLSAASLTAAANRDRAKAGQPALAENSQLNQAASAKAADMVSRGYWAHTTPDGQQPWSFITSAGYQYQAAGENLAYGFSSADDIENAWIHSPEHRGNLLSGLYSQVGYGVAQAPNFQGRGPASVIVAMFASPAGPGPEQPVAASTLMGSRPVSRLETAALAPRLMTVLVGLVGAAAVLFVTFRHGLKWHKLISRGELFVVEHPLLDIALVGLAMLAFVLNYTVGFIR